MKYILQIILAIFLLGNTKSAPVVKENERQAKQLSLLDYIQPNFNNFNNEVDYVHQMGLENDLGRTVPGRKGARPQLYNSPVYYVRLPPQPYMFVPGLGYVSQPPPPSPMSQFVNVPVSFVSNGKPAGIYQWTGSFGNFPTEAPPSSFSQSLSPKPTKKPSKPDSTLHKLPGTFAFNGHPEDIYVLRDSYNSLYNDVLQNVYP